MNCDLPLRVRHGVILTFVSKASSRSPAFPSAGRGSRPEANPRGACPEAEAEGISREIL
jgi:hypothetical protein